MMRVSYAVAFALFLAASSRLIAVDPSPPPGHSGHGESFSDGPRRFARLLGGTGDVHFPVTTKSPEAQQFFDQGVGQLHGFWYYEAERSFRQVLQIDPDCIMAYWGMAMANVENEERARGVIKKAVEKLSLASEKEKLWIQSVEKYYAEKKDDAARKEGARQLVRDWEEIAERWPEDIEAKAFIVCQLWMNAYRKGMELGSHLSVDALAELVFQKNPRHPAHHYIIHLWDHERAARALASAAMCGPAAPSIAHMWHMPGHIYSDLERWPDAVWQQEAATRVDHRMMMQRGTMPDQIHNYAHNSEWMIRNWNHLGRVKDALIVAKNMIEEPRIPRSTKVKDQPDQKWEEGGTAWALGRQRLLETLLRYEMWDSVVELAPTPYLEPGDRFEERILRQQLVSLAWYRKGDGTQGKAALNTLLDELAALKKARSEAGEKAETEARTKRKNADEINKSMAEAMLPHTKKVDQLLKVLEEVQVWEALTEERREDAQKLRQGLRDVPDDRLAVMDFQLGKVDEALKLARSFAEKHKSHVQPLARLIELLLAAGKMEDAKKEFERLRKVAAWADLDLPVFQRLEPVRQAMGLPADWRTPSPAPTDLGERPPLDSLGPLKWSPRQAPSWQLTDGEGKPVRSADYAGRPHILIFFLGKGCAHCIQQLHAFEPKHEEFAKAGLPILTISTDTTDGVQETMKLAKQQGGFPFPILANNGMDVFKAFDAFDDFENKPLHGTFFIDEAGSIRWQHISYEPFMEADFLLKEAQRLLRMSRGMPHPVAQQ